MNKVKKFAHKGRFAVIERFRKHIIVYAIAGGLVSAGLFLAFDRQMQFYLLGAGVISVLYTLPIFGKKMRLRDFSYIKIFLIACVWAYVTETIPLLRNNHVKTIPTLLGASNATYLSLGLICIAGLIEWFVIQDQHIGSTSAIMAYVVTAVIIWMVRTKKNDYYFSGLLDGTIMLPYLMLVING